MADHQPYQLASLGDLVECLIDGWSVAALHYADSCSPVGPAVPGACVELRRAGGERLRLLIADDGRSLSHRALVRLFRERPEVWKQRGPEPMHPPEPVPAGAPMAAEEWGEPIEPFPDGLIFAPETLRDVVPVGQTQTVDGLAVALTAVERYVDGARVRYLAHATDAAGRGQMAVLEAAAVDDAGRLYRVAAIERTQRGNRLEGALAIAPAPPLDVARLTVTIGTMGESDAPSAAGPWVFPIQLRADR